MGTVQLYLGESVLKKIKEIRMLIGLGQQAAVVYKQADCSSVGTARVNREWDRHTHYPLLNTTLLYQEIERVASVFQNIYPNSKKVSTDPHGEYRRSLLLFRKRNEVAYEKKSKTASTGLAIRENGGILLSSAQDKRQTFEQIKQCLQEYYVYLHA